MDPSTDLSVDGNFPDILDDSLQERAVIVRSIPSSVRAATPKDLMRRLLAVTVAGVGTALTTAVPAYAHASFRPPNAPANSDQRLVLNVPVERQDHNVRVVVEVPDGFTVLGCDAKADWGCTTAPPKGRTKALVTFTRQSGTGGDDDFAFQCVRPAPAGTSSR